MFYTGVCFVFLAVFRLCYFQNLKTAVLSVSVVFKFFEDCSFSVSIVLKYLFLYSNIFCLCTAVLHSKYLLHIYIQIFVTEMASSSTPVNLTPNHGENPEKFNGTDFKRWQQKMLFYLTTLNLTRFLNEDGPKLDVGETENNLVSGSLLSKNGKSRHRAKDCRAKKRHKTQANMMEKIFNGVDDINLTAMISECNMAGNPKEWWIDTGATRHICANISMFSSYTTVGSDEKLYMGNSSTSKVEGVEKIALKMKSGKTVTLINVLHVPNVHKNLVSGSLLSKNGFKLVFVSDKFVLSKNEMYVGKGYLSDGLFKLNVMTVVTKDDLNKVAYSYVLESSNIWHARLGHVNYKSIKKLMNMGLLQF